MSEMPKPTIAGSLLGSFRQVKETAKTLIDRIPGKSGDKTLAEQFEDRSLDRAQAHQDLEAFESDVTERRRVLTREVERAEQAYTAAAQNILNAQVEAKAIIDKFMNDPMSVSKEDFDAASAIMRIKVE